MKAAVLALTFCVLAVPACAQPANPADLDIRNGVPASQAGQLPNTGERYRALQQQIQKVRPGVETARQRSEALAAQADRLRQQLIATAARVQLLETERQRIGSDLARLGAKEKVLSAKFAQDRIRVSHLLGVLERLQSDLPPAIALEPADALRSARGAMALGAAMPRVYGAAAALSRQLSALKRARTALGHRRTDSVKNAARLSAAQTQLDKLLAQKQRQASGAGEQYAALQRQFDTIAARAADLKTLLDRVTALRQGAAREDMVVIGGSSGAVPGLRPGSLAKPVAGQLLTGPPGEKSPGMTFLAPSGAAVVAPADSHVIFAGPYHKAGQILILEAAGGYELVLAGLDRIYVETGDGLLAGEPVGRMPRGTNGATLYFELRQGGKSVNPAPWLGIDLRKAKKS